MYKKIVKKPELSRKPENSNVSFEALILSCTPLILCLSSNLSRISELFLFVRSFSCFPLRIQFLIRIWVFFLIQYYKLTHKIYSHWCFCAADILGTSYYFVCQLSDTLNETVAAVILTNLDLTSVHVFNMHMISSHRLIFHECSCDDF